MAEGPADLARLRNVGPVSAARLREVGIRTPGELRQVGAVEAYLRLRRAFPAQTTEVTLYALHGALTGVRWYELDPELRAALRDAVSRRL